MTMYVGRKKLVEPNSLSSFDLLIPKKNLVGGLWYISVEWTYDGKSYLNKEELYFQ